MPVTIDGTTGISGPASGLTDLNASNLSTGTVPDARFPATLPAASGANLTSLNASNLGSGTVPDARFPATLPAASGANLTSLNASNLSTGTVGTARLASGTADSTTYLRGDQTWATVSTTPTTAQVLSATAGASVGAVGTYALCRSAAATSLVEGSTYSGSNLRYSGVVVQGGSNGNYILSTADGGTPAGTWRAMGKANSFSAACSTYYPITLLLRIS